MNERGNVRVRERIIEMTAVSTTHNQALAAEQAKLLRDGRHVRIREARELRHTPFAFGKTLEELQSTYVARGAKDRSGAIKRFVRKSRARVARGMFVIVGHSQFTTSRARELPRDTSSVKHFVVFQSVQASTEIACHWR
jgi:hypothetical protein